MATLGYTLTDIRNELSRLAGLSGTYSSDTTAEKANIDEAIKRGTQWFYHPPAIDGVSAHKWKFLEAIFSFSMKANEWRYLLPEDFGYADDVGTFNDQAGRWTTMKQVPESVIRENRQLRGDSDNSYNPTVYAIWTLDDDGRDEPRYELQVDPPPGTTIKTQLKYTRVPRQLDATYLYHLGGPVHAKTFMAACNAAMEFYLKDERGQYWEDFMMCLKASIDQDNYQKPTMLGMMTDTSDGPSFHRHQYQNNVTYDGVLYE